VYFPLVSALQNAASEIGSPAIKRPFEVDEVEAELFCFLLLSTGAAK
jgi:hypothetical protein